MGNCCGGGKGDGSEVDEGTNTPGPIVASGLPTLPGMAVGSGKLVVVTVGFTRGVGVSEAGGATTDGSKIGTRIAIVAVLVAVGGGVLVIVGVRLGMRVLVGVGVEVRPIVGKGVEVG